MTFICLIIGSYFKTSNIIIKSKNNRLLIDDIIKQITLNKNLIKLHYHYINKQYIPSKGWIIDLNKYIVFYVDEVADPGQKIADQSFDLYLYGFHSFITAYLNQFSNQTNNTYNLKQLECKKDTYVTSAYTIIESDPRDSFRALFRKVEQKGIPFMSTEQKSIVEQIISIYDSMRDSYNKTFIPPQLKVLITGDPGIGKSTIAHILASRLNGYFTAMDLSTPGFRIQEYYGHLNFSEHKPLIFLVDEFDVLIDSCLKNAYEQKGETARRAVYDKPSLNSFLDSISIYPGLIIIFTSNKSLDYFQNDDRNCFVRTGRIDLKICMKSLTGDDIKYLLKQITSLYNWDTDSKLKLEKVAINQPVIISDIINIFKLHNLYGPTEVINQFTRLIKHE
jgi:hypothetical protein